MLTYIGGKMIREKLFCVLKIGLVIVIAITVIVLRIQFDQWYLNWQLMR